MFSLISIAIMIVYLFLFLAASVQGDGKPFDTEIFPPGSVNFDCWPSSLWEWSELDDGLHTLLSPEELHFVFGTKDHSMVSKEEYRVVAIKDTLQQAKQVAKRAGVMISVRYRNRSWTCNWRHSSSRQGLLNWHWGQNLQPQVKMYQYFEQN